MAEQQDVPVVDDVPAGDPAPAPENTAPPEPVGDQPEVETEKPSKTFTQEELDEQIGKRLAREQRKWERQQREREAAQVAAPVAPVSQDQFESPEAYAEALAEQKAAQILADREAQRQRAEIAEAYSSREEEAREKYADFESVAYNPRLKITQAMAEVIQASEIGPDVVYHLGLNPKEAERISKLAPLAQAREIGRLEAKLADAPPVKKASSAPAPITPIASRQSSAPVFDTTDPRSTKTMSTSEWIEAERARQRRKAEAQQH